MATGISESWLKVVNMEGHLLEAGYNLMHKGRPLRSGGGSIYLYPRFPTTPEKNLDTKIAQLTPFSLKSTRIRLETTKLSLLGLSISQSILTFIRLTHWPLGDLNVILKMLSSILLY